MHSRTILFVDEIHRFNKAQQDAFLPYVERGTIRLIGATTENPSFEIISALLSRCRVYVLEPLKDEQIVTLLRRALADNERGLGALELTADDDALELIAGYSSGDCRNAYNTLEVAAQLAMPTETKHITKATCDRSRAAARADVRQGRARSTINLISALHKSVRNSDPDAALYWLGRMFAGGEDPLYLARRIVRMAVEDIGLAAPEALNLCLSAKDTYDFLGSPEGELALAEAVVYLALAPKSNAVYTAFGAVQDDIEHTRQEPVPLHLRNAPTRLMKELGYAKGYRYAHDEEGKVADMDCLPESLKGRSYYHPTQEGREKQLARGWRRSGGSGRASADRSADLLRLAAAFRKLRERVDDDAGREHLRQELRGALARRIKRVHGHAAAAKISERLRDGRVLAGPVGARTRRRWRRQMPASPQAGRGRRAR